MHLSQELSSASFDIDADGRRLRLDELFEGFNAQDRLGIVIRSAFAAIGASALLTATITAFNDFHRSRGSDFVIYADYFLFHVGQPLGDHARMDVWPPNKELVVPDDPEEILRAINDRAITRLAVEDAEPGEPAFAFETVTSARDRILSCLAYSPSGRVRDGDVHIASNSVSESYVSDILAPETWIDELLPFDARQQAYADAIATPGGDLAPESRAPMTESRKALIENGSPVETYRRIDLDEALLLVAGTPNPLSAQVA